MISLIPALVLWIYWPALDGPFLWDDEHTILGNWLIVNGNWRGALQSMWRGLLVATFAATVRNSGLSPKAFHSGNEWIHIANSALMVGLARTLGFSLIQAECLGLLFAAHPLAVASVAQISGRSGSLMGTFWIAALWAHCAGHPILAAVSVVLAIWVREDAAVLLLTLACLSHSFYGLLYLTPLLYGFRRRVRISLMSRLKGVRTEQVEPGLHSRTRPQPEFSCAVITESLWRLCGWSFGFGHRFDHELPLFGFRRFAKMLWLLPVAFLVAVDAKDPILQIGMTIVLYNPWLVAAIIPSKDPILEHRFYAVLPGIILLAGAICRVSSFWLLLPAIMLMATRTRYLAGRWASALALWKYIYNRGKSKSPMVRLNLGTAYYNLGDRPRALWYWNEALQLCPNAVGARCNIAAVQIAEGRYDEAKVRLEEVLTDWPTHQPSRLNLAVIDYLKKEKIDQPW